jgi:ornithine carbamoyltransferase
MSRKRDFLSLKDSNKDEILQLLHRAGELKAGALFPGSPLPLEGRCVGMIFEKSSTRTRVSFEVGIRHMGGYPIFLNKDDIQLGRGEPMSDTARVLSRYLDAIVMRTFGHDIIEELARFSSVPVINGLTDLFHPCQVLADLFTVQEAGMDVTTMKAGWIGDGNNMANSWINAAEILGFHLTLACPQGYDPDVGVDSGNVTLSRDPFDAVRDADVLSTDVWASMGQEEEALERKAAFKDYQVNADLLKSAEKPVWILHCLPAHRGEEITEEVIDSDHSLIWQEAGNRLHVQKALLELLLCK